MTSKRVSVIMPVYNEAEYLSESINSFLSQTISSSCELICVDDGSTDNSLDILNSFRQEHDNISVIHQSNLGSGAARNTGIDAAEGEFVAFLDADDMYPYDDVLEALYDMANRKNVNAAGGSISILENGQIRRFAAEGLDARYYVGQAFDYDCVIEYSAYQFEYGYYRFIFKRDMLISAGVRFPQFLRFQDPGFFVRALDAAGEFGALQKETYLYRSNPDKAAWNRAKIIDLLDGIIDLAEFSNKKRYAKLFCNAVHRLRVDFDPIIHDVIVSEIDGELLGKLFEANRTLREIGKELDTNVDELFLNETTLETASTMLREYPEYRERLLSAEQALDDSKKLIHDLENTKDRLDRELESTQSMLDHERDISASRIRELEIKNSKLESSISNLKKSNSWRIGRVMTFPVRKLKQVARNRKRI